MEAASSGSLIEHPGSARDLVSTGHGTWARHNAARPLGQGQDVALDLRFLLWGGEDLNLRPTDYEAAALTPTAGPRGPPAGGRIRPWPRRRSTRPGRGGPRLPPGASATERPGEPFRSLVVPAWAAATSQSLRGRDSNSQPTG